MFPLSFFPNQYFPNEYFPHLGQGLAPTPIVGGHGFRGAGRYIYAQMQMEQMERARRSRSKFDRLPPAGMIRKLMEERVTLSRREAIQVHHKRIAENAMFSVLVSEL